MCFSSSFRYGDDNNTVPINFFAGMGVRDREGTQTGDKEI